MTFLGIVIKWNNIHEPLIIEFVNKFKVNTILIAVMRLQKYSCTSFFCCAAERSCVTTVYCVTLPVRWYIICISKYINMCIINSTYIGCGSV